MGIGFEVSNEQGYKQIIDTAPLITYKDKIYSTDTANNPHYVDYTYLFALKPASENILILSTLRRIYDDATGYKYRLGGTGEVMRFNEGVSPAPSSNSFGLEIFNDEGVLQFSSNQRPFRVLDVVKLDNIWQTDSIVNGRRVFWSKNYGDKEVAAFMITLPLWAESPNMMTIGLSKRSGITYFEAGIDNVDKSYADRWTANYNTLHALVIDVTNY